MQEITMLTPYLLTKSHDFSVYLISETWSTIWTIQGALRKFINVHETMCVHWPGRPRRTKPRPCGAKRCLTDHPGRPTPLWHQLSMSLACMLPTRRQREHQLHKVGLANNHGWSAMWWPLVRLLAQRQCRQVWEPTLGHYKYPLRSTLWYTHTL
jgi:hypothetical protein